MSTNRITIRTRDSTVDHLALSRAQHLQSRENRPKSISDDEVDAISDWSDSDRECSPLSDFEYNTDFDDKDYPQQENKLLPEISHVHASRVIETPLPIIDDSNTSTRISFTNEHEKRKHQISKRSSSISVKQTKQSQTPLLPARRMPKKEISNSKQIPYTPRYRKTNAASPTRLYLRRENTSTSTSSNKDSTNSSFQSHDDHQNSRQVISPNLSLASVPRVYEIKKIFADDSDYGRLTEISVTRPSRPQSRQKWGTIVHPPFPLGYQQMGPDQVTQAVERLSSPLRCRERHTPIHTPSKRYLSVEETQALVMDFRFIRIFE